MSLRAKPIIVEFFCFCLLQVFCPRKILKNTVTRSGPYTPVMPRLGIHGTVNPVVREIEGDS